MTQTDFRSLLTRAREEGLRAIEDASDLLTLEVARITALGRKAPLARARGSLGSLPEDERKSLGRVANDVQQELERAFEQRRSTLEAAARELRWERERVDVTLPGTAPEVGSIHPLTRATWEIVDIFIGLGYRVAEGPEVELITYNFDALNFLPEHPSRAPTDTFYIRDAEDTLCLRTHTSPVQTRVMEQQEPPVYVVVPGRVYRPETEDPTHLSGFTQIEGLAVDEDITMGDLKGTLEVFAHEIFGRDLDVRLRPSFFPFTEPSAEMDVQCFLCRGADPHCRMCKGEGWIEILGCGMVDPNVLEWVGYDAERYTGFAFGMGVERIVALTNGVNDIRYLWENDLRFLRQFGGLL